MSNRKRSGGIVYRTDAGRICPGCVRPVSQCICADNSRSGKRAATQAPTDGFVRLHRETKGRKGAGVTIVRGLPLAHEELAKLAKSLKKKCGVGGAVKGDAIELQGDQRDRLKSELESAGFKVKLAGA